MVAQIRKGSESELGMTGYHGDRDSATVVIGRRMPILIGLTDPIAEWSWQTAEARHVNERMALEQTLAQVVWET